MRIIRSFLLSVLSIVFGVGSIYILEMFLNEGQIKFLIGGIFFIAIIIVIVFSISILRKKTKQKKFIKTKLDAFLLIMSIFLIIAGSSYISIYNIAMYEVFGDNLSISQKIENRKILKNYNKGRKKYDEDIASYIKGLDREKIGHVSLYYGDDIDGDYPQTIKESIPLAEELIENIYGELNKDPLKIVFYNEENWNKIEEINTELVQGFYDGDSIRIKGFLKDQSLWHMEENFIHEYAHYALDMYRYQNNILSPIPSWFNEGICEYIAAYKKDRDYSFDYIKYPVDVRELETDEEFWDSLEEAIALEEFYDPYVYSYYMIDSLVDLKGEDIITNIILRSKQTEFYEAFKEEVGVGIEEYQKVNLVEYVNKKIQEDK